MREKDLHRLFDEHAEPLLKFLIYRTGDRALAEDIVADTFERAMRKLTLFDRARGTEKAWLYTIATNLLRDGARKREVEERAYASAYLPEPAFVGGDGGLGRFEARATVMEAMEALSSEEREAVALRFGADLTVPEMARVLDQPLTTVEGRVYRALRKLRSQLGDDEG
jgi:RNA polymerase sigma-70 factor (ECF subfamily)